MAAGSPGKSISWRLLFCLSICACTTLVGTSNYCNILVVLCLVPNGSTVCVLSVDDPWAQRRRQLLDSWSKLYVAGYSATCRGFFSNMYGGFFPARGFSTGVFP